MKLLMSTAFSHQNNLQHVLYLHAYILSSIWATKLVYGLAAKRVFRCIYTKEGTMWHPTRFFGLSFWRNLSWCFLVEVFWFLLEHALVRVTIHGLRLLNKKFSKQNHFRKLESIKKGLHRWINKTLCSQKQCGSCLTLFMQAYR